MRTISAIFVIFGTLLLFTVTGAIESSASSSGKKIYIRDRTGASWDITEAVERGFKPGKFKFGLGKSAIPPLNDGDLGHLQFSGREDSSILGISVGEESHAYSINKLASHEIANTTIAGNKIAAAY